MSTSLEAQKVNKRPPSNKCPSLKPKNVVIAHSIPSQQQQQNILAQREVRGPSVVFQNWF